MFNGKLYGRIRVTTNSDEQRKKMKTEEQDEKLISFQELQNLIPLGRTKLYELMKDNKLPKPVKIGARSLWRQKSIFTWIQKLK